MRTANARQPIDSIKSADRAKNVFRSLTFWKEEVGRQEERNPIKSTPSFHEEHNKSAPTLLFGTLLPDA